jgi:hypothetical protein
MMIRSDARLTDEQPAATHQLFVAVDPDVEILVCLVARKRHMHALDDAPPLGRGKEEGAQEDFR